MMPSCENHQKLIGLDDAPVAPGRETATHGNDLRELGGGDKAGARRAQLSSSGSSFGRMNFLRPVNQGEVSTDQEMKFRTDRRAHELFEVDRRQSATPLTNRKEVVGLTGMLAHPPLEDVSSETTELLLPDL